MHPRGPNLNHPSRTQGGHVPVVVPKRAVLDRFLRSGGLGYYGGLGAMRDQEGAKKEK